MPTAQLRMYQTYEVEEIVQQIEVQAPYLLDRYFGRVRSFDTEMIVLKRPQVTPFMMKS